MPSDRTGLVSQIFYGALDVPEGDRPDFVRERCAEDADLAGSILRLLSQHARLGDFLDAPAFSPAAPGLFRPGDAIGRFTIEAFLGRGGMGEVYRAHDGQLNETVALKMLRPRWRGEEHFTARFRDEIRLARKIGHPHVCRIFDLFVEERGAEELLYFTMEFLEGETLADRISRGPLTPAETLAIARPIASGLDAAHAAGVVHRDLKPANIFLAREANGAERAVIADFGLAGAFGGAETPSGASAPCLIGTLDYMAQGFFNPALPPPRTYTPSLSSCTKWLAAVCHILARIRFAPQSAVCIRRSSLIRTLPLRQRLGAHPSLAVSPSHQSPATGRRVSSLRISRTPLP